MRPSAAVRWFYRGKLPQEVRDWFCGASLCKEETVRTDYHIVLPGSNEVSVIVRDGRKLEIRARTKAPVPLSLAAGVSIGRQDTWAKLRLEDSVVARRLAALGGNSPNWVPVSKKRWLRKFRIDATGRVEEAKPDAAEDDRCRVELTELKVRDSPWWTLAFDSLGDGNRTAKLEQVARHFLRVLPHGLVLGERESMAYPEWLNRLAG